MHSVHTASLNSLRVNQTRDGCDLWPYNTPINHFNPEAQNYSLDEHWEYNGAVHLSYTQPSKTPVFKLGGRFSNATVIQSGVLINLIVLKPSPPWKAYISSPNQEIPAFYGTRIFPTVFIRSRHQSLPWARSIHSTPSFHFLKIRFNIIFPSTPNFYKLSPSVMFPHLYPAGTCPCPIRSTCTTHLVILDLITRTILGEE